jgi:Fic family protein
MTWSWQMAAWPEFSYDAESIRPLEEEFLHGSGLLLGAFAHLGDDEKAAVRIEFLSDEALETSKIEGEFLNRESLQSSIRGQFGLPTDGRKVSPAEQGVSEVLIDVYRHFEGRLTKERLCGWQSLLMRGRWDLKDIGDYRNSPESMQIVSGALHAPNVHFEAPPSDDVARHMAVYLEWFNDKAIKLPALTRAALAHLYFETIHPFEDGNGRVGRAICELSLSQSLNKPLLISLSQTIGKRKKLYYEQLEIANRTLEVTGWVNYFAGVILEAQRSAVRQIEFLIAKAKFFDRYRDKLNVRQEKVLVRIFAAGIDGFAGGLSASNYASIAKTTPATVTRDLHDLVQKGALLRSGERKSTRYRLNLKDYFSI